MKGSIGNIPLREKWLDVTGSSAIYIELNITKNTCGDYYFSESPERPIPPDGTVSSFIEGLAENIVSQNLQEEFIERFSLASYEEDIRYGVYTKKMRLPLSEAGRGVHWYMLTTKATRDPETDDLLVFAAFSDVDREIRLEHVIERILSREYELLCQVDIQSGRIFKVGKNIVNPEISFDDNDINYNDVYADTIRAILPSEFHDDGIEALSLETVIRKLSSATSYSCMFPVVTEGGAEKICRWSFEYTDDTRSTLLMKRRNITRFLDYGYDSLTGVFNRNGFHRYVRNELLANMNRRFCLIELDFDNFKLINEEYGYDEGNSFLRHFGSDIRQIAKTLGKGSCVGHLEADHFVFLLPMDIGISPKKLYDLCNESIKKHHIARRVKLRMGVYEITDHTLDVPLMHDFAHIAHKATKGKFVDELKYYSADLRDKMLDEQLLISEMQHAIDTEQFEIWFQPQVNHAVNGILIGAEALVRWRHPIRGMISPAVFIPIFEQNGFIYELDKYVWDHTCRHMRCLLDMAMPPLPISVNISRLDILQSDFFETIVDIVDRNHIPHDLLHLEITESAFTESADSVVQIVKRLIENGFTIAIDDFGSGYSSLSMIKSVPAQILKLDMRFFQSHDEGRRNECIIESITRMSKMLGMAVLAEGVEHFDQAEFLRSVGCSYIQGFLYSRPLPFSEFLKYLNDNNIKSASDGYGRMPDYSMQPNSTDLFHNILSGSNDIIIVADIATKQLLYANHAAEKYYGKVFDPMLPTSCSEYCNNSKSCENCPALSLNSEEHVEMVYKEKDHHFKADYVRMTWNGHNAFVFSQTDISSEMRQLELTDSLISNLPVALIVFAQGTSSSIEINYVSKQALRYFAMAGIEKPTYTLEDAYATVHPDDLPAFKSVVEKSIRDKCGLHEELRLCLKDGSVIWIELTIKPVIESNGTYKYYCLYTDISDRKDSQARADMMISKLPLALSIFSSAKYESKLIFMNDAAQKLLCLLDSHSVDADTIFSRVHPDDIQRLRELGKYAVEYNVPISGEFRILTDDCSFRWIQLDSTPMQRNDSDYFHYCIFSDIDAQKSIESVGLEKDIYIHTHSIVNMGLQQALRQSTPQQSIEYIIGFMGKSLKGERAYIFERNYDGTDSNTFEWVADGITPQKQNLQNLPGEVCQPWYEQFKNESAIIIKDVEDIRETHPIIYEALVPQNISSLIVAPFFNERGEAVGFFGLDNPPVDSLNSNSIIVQTIAFFIEASIKRIKFERHQTHTAET